MKIYKYGPLPVPPNGGKPGALLCQEDLHFIQQSGNTGFQPCKGEIFVARGKATQECRPGLDKGHIFRPRFNVVQSRNPFSDGIMKFINKPISQSIGSTPSGLIDSFATFRGFHPRLFKFSPFRTTPIQNT